MRGTNQTTRADDEVKPTLTGMDSVIGYQLALYFQNLRSPEQASRGEDTVLHMLDLERATPYCHDFRMLSTARQDGWRCC
jgi:hypothetical protein